MSSLMHSFSNSVSSPKPSSRVGHSLYSRSFYQKQKGFTLLELVLVMLIIGLVASTPLVFIDNQDNQFRYEQTLEKMELIEKAVYQQNFYRNQPVLSGFIIDNGVLPPITGSSGLASLVNDDNGWLKASTGPVYPYYKIDSNPAVSAAYPQMKGYRGHYISDGIDSNNRFLDGWGWEFEVSSTATGSYYFNFKGDDGNHPAPYNVAVSGAIDHLDWKVRLNQIDIQLENGSGDEKVVALVVFQNKAGTDAGRWETYHFSIAMASGGISTIEHSLSFTSSEWKKGDEVGSPDPVDTYIPAGQHPVFVLDNSDPNNVKVEDYDRLLVVPRSTQPALQFEVN